MRNTRQGFEEKKKKVIQLLQKWLNQKIYLKIEINSVSIFFLSHLL